VDTRASVPAGPGVAPIPVPSTAGEAVKTGEVPTVDVTAAIHELNGQLQDAFFDYDRSDLRPEAIAILRRDADLLLSIRSEFPKYKVIIEGHCDERGSAEYNLALGDRRAGRAAEVLHEFGLPVSSSQTVSYGKEAPQCMESTESCWRRNRRAHLVVRQ
jgi:peptidoglycan-associated lipoprotein